MVVVQNSTEAEKEEILALNTEDVKLMFGKGAWRRTLLGVFMSGFQQLTGVDGLLYYVLFCYPGGTGCLVVTIIAQFYTDKW